VLDAELRDRPAWVVGELYIGGDGLSRGYFGDAERTNERFIIHPRTGERLYRTGDLGRHLPGGNIEFLGRVDTQIKLRGFRVELGEIEAALGQHPAVSACAVVPEGPPRAPSQLVAYVVPRAVDASGGAPDRPLQELCAAAQRELSREPPALGQSEQEDVLAHLAARLPSYMVPAAILPLQALPLSPNGKVDRAALSRRRAAEQPAAGPSRSRAQAEYVAPRTLTESSLAALWEKVLGGGPYGAEDDFLVAGGDSLLGARLISTIDRAFGVTVSMAELYEERSLGALALLIEERVLEQALATQADAGVSTASIGGE
jgi:hypothetical protein